MIKKISSLLFFLVALTAFSQKAKDQLGIEEAMILSDRKFALNKSTKNTDKSIIQEYHALPKEEQTAKEKGFIPHKLIVTYKPVSANGIKELLEQKIQDIRKIKNAQNVFIEEVSSGLYKISYDVPKEKSVENRILYYKYIEHDEKYSGYVAEFFPGTDDKIEDLDMNLFKFIETIRNQ